MYSVTTSKQLTWQHKAMIVEMMYKLVLIDYHFKKNNNKLRYFCCRLRYRWLHEGNGGRMKTCNCDWNSRKSREQKKTTRRCWSRKLRECQFVTSNQRSVSPIIDLLLCFFSYVYAGLCFLMLFRYHVPFVYLLKAKRKQKYQTEFCILCCCVLFPVAFT